MNILTEPQYDYKASYPQSFLIHIDGRDYYVPSRGLAAWDSIVFSVGRSGIGLPLTLSPGIGHPAHDYLSNLLELTS